MKLTEYNIMLFAPAEMEDAEADEVLDALEEAEIDSALDAVAARIREVVPPEVRVEVIA